MGTNFRGTGSIRENRENRELYGPNKSHRYAFEIYLLYGKTPPGCCHREYWIQGAREKVNTWTGEVIQLAKTATTQPHAAFAGFTHGLSSRWTYVQEQSPTSNICFQPLEDAIHLIIIHPFANGSPSMFKTNQRSTSPAGETRRYGANKSHRYVKHQLPGLRKDDRTTCRDHVAPTRPDNRCWRNKYFPHQERNKPGQRIVKGVTYKLPQFTTNYHSMWSDKANSRKRMEHHLGYRSYLSRTRVVAGYQSHLLWAGSGLIRRLVCLYGVCRLYMRPVAFMQPILPLCSLPPPPRMQPGGLANRFVLFVSCLNHLPYI